MAKRAARAHVKTTAIREKDCDMYVLLIRPAQASSHKRRLTLRRHIQFDRVDILFDHCRSDPIALSSDFMWCASLPFAYIIDFDILDQLRDG